MTMNAASVKVEQVPNKDDWKVMHLFAGRSSAIENHLAKIISCLKNRDPIY